MDLHCRHCGEPWDHDELHYLGEYTGEDMSYKQAVKRFLALGCKAFNPDSGKLRERAGLAPKPEHCTRSPIYPPEMMDMIRQSQDMSPYPDEWMGPDDIECMLELAEDIFG